LNPSCLSGFATLRLAAVTAESPLRFAEGAASVDCRGRLGWRAREATTAGPFRRGRLPLRPKAVKWNRARFARVFFRVHGRRLRPREGAWGSQRFPPTAGGARYLGRARKRLLPTSVISLASRRGAEPWTVPAGSRRPRRERALASSSEAARRRDGGIGEDFASAPLRRRELDPPFSHLRHQSVYPQNGQESLFSTHELCGRPKKKPRVWRAKPGAKVGRKEKR